MATTPYQATYSLSPKYGTRYGPSQYVAPTQNAAAPDQTLGTAQPATIAVGAGTAMVTPANQQVMQPQQAVPVAQPNVQPTQQLAYNQDPFAMTATVNGQTTQNIGFRELADPFAGAEDTEGTTVGATPETGETTIIPTVSAQSSGSGGDSGNPSYQASVVNKFYPDYMNDLAFEDYEAASELKPSFSFMPSLSDLTSNVSDYYNNLTSTGVGTEAFNTGIDVLSGMPFGMVSTLVNPTMTETPWGTDFNTGGGGITGVGGKIALKNFENIYSKEQEGIPGYDFYAPGEIPGINTPIAISPGIIPGSRVLSGNTNLLPDSFDINGDGKVTVTEFEKALNPTDIDVSDVKEYAVSTGVDPTKATIDYITAVNDRDSFDTYSSNKTTQNNISQTEFDKYIQDALSGKTFDVDVLETPPAPAPAPVVASQPSTSGITNRPTSSNTKSQEDKNDDKNSGDKGNTTDKGAAHDPLDAFNKGGYVQPRYNDSYNGGK